MCGIVAVSGVSDAAYLSFLALYSLQHRGQEAAGVISVDDEGRAHLHRATGLVADAFGPETFSHLPGSSALGHIRYSTAGGAGLQNAQPIRVRYAEGDLSVVHNGNLTNGLDVRERLVEEGALFQSTIDSEVVVHLIARSRRDGIDDQIDDALSQLEGAFSLLITVGDTLYVARDPQGFRPLVMGRMGDGHVFASETCALDIMGAEYIRDVEPGEVLRVRGPEVVSLRPLSTFRKPRPCIFELVYFARPDSSLWGISVDRARRAFGRRLAQEHPVDADIVIAVPDSANSSALGYSEESEIPFELGLIRNHYVGRTFIDPTQAQRDFKVRLKYSAVREALDGKRVIVVDDSLVRGTTSHGLVTLLREAGATEVHFRFASPPVRHPCFYGIDMPTREELLASSLNPEQIRQRLGVDSLGYLSLEGMVEAAEGPDGQFCHACFSGEYSTPLVDLDKGLSLAAHCG